jgi:hypothetical protein
MFNQFLRQQQDTIINQVNTAVQAALHHSLPTSMSSSANSASNAHTSSIHPSIIVPHSPLPARVKLSAPPTYNGSPSINVSTWLFQIEQYLEASGVHDEQQRIVVAVSYFRELASQWWVNRVSVLQNAPTQYWDEFKEAVQQRFQPISASRTARAELRSLRQNSKSVSEYQSEFYRIIQLINNMSEEDQIENFVFGLKPAIWNEFQSSELQS